MPPALPPRPGSLTQHVGGIELHDQPAVSLVGVGAEDGEDGALLAGLSQQLVDVHLPLGELEVGPRLPFVGAEPGSVRQGYVYIMSVSASEPHYCYHGSYCFVFFHLILCNYQCLRFGGTV